MRKLLVYLLVVCVWAIGMVPADGMAQSVSGGKKAPAPDTTAADDSQSSQNPAKKIVFTWHDFPNDARFKVLGLHWFDVNRPLMWRLPKIALEGLPKGVVNRAMIPSGGRIYFKCTATQLGLKVLAKSKGNGSGLDVYINGRFYKSAVVENPGVETELVLFSGLDRKEKEIVVYLPHHQELLITAVGVDKDTVFHTPVPSFRKSSPIVFYGSSVSQGTGASRPGMTYEAILARELGVDFVNLGFGGAGKAEKDVVELVNSIPACCYVFDLGKSYGMQDKTAFKAMLRKIRESHPDTPVICITPIASTQEMYSASYAERSIHTRTVMRDATNEVMKAGASGFYLIEGMDLLGFSECDGFSRDGVHPSDYGYSIIASKLLPTFRKVLGL